MFLCLLPLILLLVIGFVQPVQTYPPITVDNAANLHEVQRLGRGRITQIAWLPDGQSLAAAGELGVWLYQRAAPDMPRLYWTDSAVHALALSPDGAELAAITRDFRLWRWDMAGRLLENTALDVRYSQFFRTAALAYSPDGRWLAFGVEAITLRDRLSGQSRTLPCGSLLVAQLAFDAQGRRLACFTDSFSDYSDGSWSVYDTETGALIREVEETPSLGGGVFGPDGSLYVHAAFGRFYTLDTPQDTYTAALAVWSLEDGVPLSLPALIERGMEHARSVAFDAAGRVAAVFIDQPAGQQALVVQALDSGATLFSQPTPALPAYSRVYFHALSPDGASFAYHLNDGSLHLVDLRTGSTATLTDAHHPAYTALRLSPDDRYAATASDYFIYVWSLETGTLVRQLKLERFQTAALAFLPDDRLAALEMGGAVYIWSPDGVTPEIVQPPPDISRSPAVRYRGLVWDGAQLNVATCRPDDFAGPPGPLVSGPVVYLALAACPPEDSPAGSPLALNADAGALAYIVGRPESQRLRVFKRDGSLITDLPHRDQYNALQVMALNRTADRLTLASGYTAHGGGAIFVSLEQWLLKPQPRKLTLLIEDYVPFDPAEGQPPPLYTAAAPLGVPYSVVYHPLDDSLLAVGGGELDVPAAVQVWHVPADGAPSRLLTTLGQHTRPVTAVQFTSDGTRLVSAGRDGVLRVWAVG